MTASQALQRWINAKQNVETLTYGLRALDDKGEYVRAADNDELRRIKASAHMRQTAAAVALASEMRGNIYSGSSSDSRTAAWWVRWALKEAKAELKAATEAKTALGTARQLRLLIDRECDCYGCGEVRLEGGGIYYCDDCVAQQLEQARDELSTYDAYHEWADRVGKVAA